MDVLIIIHTFVLLMVVCQTNAFYVPGVAPVEFLENEVVEVKVLFVLVMI